MSEDRVHRHRHSYWVAAVASASTVIAAVVGYLTNVLTSSWNWTLFAAAAVLVAVAAGLPFVTQKIQSQQAERAEAFRLDAERRASIAARDRDRMAALRNHFRSRAQGLTPSWSRRGWYFTGRERALFEIVGWVTERDGDTRARVVTGGPGSGKSAVLGRIVTLGHQLLRAGIPASEIARTDPRGIPQAGTVHSAINVQGWSVDQVAAAIGEDLGLRVGTAGEFMASLHERHEFVAELIVIDAVDEAAEPERLIYELLEPVASTSSRTGVRVLVGTRPGRDRHLVRQFGPSTVEIDLDSAAYWDERDLTAYVRRCLLADDEPDLPTPYRGQREAAQRIASAVAAMAGRSFLIAQLTAFALAAAPSVVDPETATRQGLFPDNVGAAMDQYLARFATDRRKVRDLLLPLAWAEGDGLADRRMWARLATELGTGAYTEQDVTWLLRETKAADLLQRINRGGRNWYRLFHAALSEHLRAVSETECPRLEIQRRFAGILIEMVPHYEQGLDWLNADSYTLSYLATHACAGGVLDGLVHDPGFVVAAGAARLLSVLHAVDSEPAVAVAAVIERIGSPLLRSSTAERASYLEMSARQAGKTELAGAISSLPLERPWSSPWAHWGEQGLERGKVLGQHPSYVIDVAVVATGGQLCVVSASEWIVQARGLADGEPTGPEIQGWASPIETMAVTEGSIPVVLTLHSDGQMRRWDPITGTPSSDQIQPGEATRRDWGGSASPVIRYYDRDLIVARDGESLHLRDVTSGEQFHVPLTLGGLQRVLAAKVIHDRLLVLVELDEWRVGVWDLLADALVAEPFVPFHGTEALKGSSRSWSADITEHDGRLIAVLGGQPSSPGNSQVVVWDVVSRTTIGGDLTGHRYGVMAMTVAATENHQIICTGGGDGTVRCWQLPPGNLNGQPILTHAGGVDCITAAQTDNTLTVVSGGRDGTVRARGLKPIHSAESEQDPTVKALTCSILDGQSVVTGITNNGHSMTTWDAATGQKIIEWIISGRPVRMSTAVSIRGQTLIATAGDEVQIRFWDPGSGKLISSLQLPTGLRVDGIASWDADGRSFLIAASEDGRFYVWDALSQALTYPPIICGQTRFFITVALVDGVPHIVTMSRAEPTLRLWNLGNGEAEGTTFQPQEHERKEGDMAGDFTAGTLNGKPVGICIGLGGWVSAWDLRDGTLLLDTELKDGHGMALWAVTIGEFQGRAVVISSGYAGAITLWELDGTITQIIQTGSPVSTLATDGQRIICGGIAGILAINITGRHNPAHDPADECV